MPGGSACQMGFFELADLEWFQNLVIASLIKRTSTINKSSMVLSSAGGEHGLH